MIKIAKLDFDIMEKEKQRKAETRYLFFQMIMFLLQFLAGFIIGYAVFGYNK